MQRGSIDCHLDGWNDRDNRRVGAKPQRLGSAGGFSARLLRIVRVRLPPGAGNGHLVWNRWIDRLHAQRILVVLACCFDGSGSRRLASLCNCLALQGQRHPGLAAVARPELLFRGMAFFKRWGTLAIFLGRFFGPLRAVVPIVAGICDMPWLSFQMANLASAFVWAAGILAPGAFGLRWLLG